MKINILQLRKRKKYISCKKHNKLNLLIWNYNNSCQWNKKWDKYTKQARGLITDSQGNIVAKPFEKFFNLNETEETKLKNLPNELPEITEKYDGSLGIQYYDGENVCIATRGSFKSKQALWATYWLQERYVKTDFKEGYTYLYEIIYSENRIVIDYQDKKELILLAVKNTETGEELNIKKEAKRLGLNYPKIINKKLNSLIKYVKNLPVDKEGVVLKYSNLLRIKMKGDEYIRLHKLISNFSTLSIWECLMQNQDINEILQLVPDEFYNWVKKEKAKMENKFNLILKKSQQRYEKIKKLSSRKEQAREIMKKHKNFSKIIFKMLDNKPFDQDIWRMIKPKFELPFKDEN